MSYITINRLSRSLDYPPNPPNLPNPFAQRGAGRRFRTKTRSTNQIRQHFVRTLKRPSAWNTRVMNRVPSCAVQHMSPSANHTTTEFLQRNISDLDARRPWSRLFVWLAWCTLQYEFLRYSTGDTIGRIAPSQIRSGKQYGQHGLVGFQYNRHRKIGFIDEQWLLGFTIMEEGQVPRI